MDPASYATCAHPSNQVNMLETLGLQDDGASIPFSTIKQGDYRRTLVDLVPTLTFLAIVDCEPKYSYD